MSTRRDIPLGLGGDYAVAGQGKALARQAFLFAVDQVIPEALRNLWTDAHNLTTDAAVDAWCVRWGFTAGWLRSAVSGTAAAARAGLTRPTWTGYTLTSYWVPEVPALPAWDVLRESEAAFRARVEAHIVAVKAQPGLVAVERKRVAPTSDPFRDFEWLARYQVAGWTHVQIADHASKTAHDVVDQDAVAKAVRETAKLIDLKLRAGRGRPSKNTTQTPAR